MKQKRNDRMTSRKSWHKPIGNVFSTDEELDQMFQGAREWGDRIRQYQSSQKENTVFVRFLRFCENLVCKIRQREIRP